MSETIYDAFVSYRRRDATPVAQWLRRQLQAFRPPHALSERYPRRLRIYLDTAYERGTSDFYRDSIKPALLASRWLLVVATPEAVKGATSPTDWIHREITDFCAGPNGNNVIVVRGAGAFDDPLPGPLGSMFPNVEIVDLRGAGRFWRLHPLRAARLADEKLKVIAPLLDLPATDMPLLRQEEEARQQVRIGAAIGASLGVLATVSALSIVALRSRDQAVRALEDSLFATGSVVLLSKDMNASDEGSVARQRRLILNQSCDLVDKLSEDSGREAQVAEIVACRIERARSREDMKEYPQALASLVDAIAFATARYARKPGSDVAVRVIEARQALAEYHVRREHKDEARKVYLDLVADAERFATAHPKRSSLLESEASARGALADLLSEAGDLAEAAAAYDAMATTLQRLVERGRGDRLSAVTWLARILSVAGETRLKLNEVDAARDRLTRSVAAIASLEAGQADPDAEQTAAISEALLFELERRSGNAEEADRRRRSAEARIDRVLASPDASDDLKTRARGLKDWLAERAGAGSP